MANRYHLIVKGPMHIATTAAFDRGITHVVGAKCENGRETIMLIEAITSATHKAVIDWFNEPAHSTPGQGMPEGTLLWYGQHHTADDVLRAISTADAA